MLDVRLHTVQRPGQHLPTLSVGRDRRLRVSRPRLVRHPHRQRVDDLVVIDRRRNKARAGSRVRQGEVGRYPWRHGRLGRGLLDVRISEDDPYEVAPPAGVRVLGARGCRGPLLRVPWLADTYRLPVAQGRSEHPDVLTHRRVIVDLRVPVELDAIDAFVVGKRVRVADPNRAHRPHVTRSVRRPATTGETVECVRVTYAAGVILDRRGIVQGLAAILRIAWIARSDQTANLRERRVGRWLHGCGVRGVENEAVAVRTVRVHLVRVEDDVGPLHERGAGRDPIGVVVGRSTGIGVWPPVPRPEPAGQCVHLVGGVVAGEIVVLLPGRRLIPRRTRRETDRPGALRGHPEPDGAAGHVVPVGWQCVASGVQLRHVDEVIVDPAEREVEFAGRPLNRGQRATVDERRAPRMFRGVRPRMPVGIRHVELRTALNAPVVLLAHVRRVESDVHGLRHVGPVRCPDGQPVRDRVGSWIGAFAQPHGPLQIDIHIVGVVGVVPLLPLADPLPLDVHHERVLDQDGRQLDVLATRRRAVQHDLIAGHTVRYNRCLHDERGAHLDSAEVTGELRAVVGDARCRVHIIGQTQVRNLVEERLVHRERRHDVVHRVIARRLLVVIDIDAPLGNHGVAPGDRGGRVDPLSIYLVHRGRRGRDVRRARLSLVGLFCVRAIAGVLARLVVS